MSEPIRAVYDCMILLQAAGRPQRVHATMRAVHEGRVSLCFSPSTVSELRDVLTRPEVQAKFPSLLPDHVNAFIAKLLDGAVLLDIVPHVFTLPRDPKDEPYVDLAIAAQANFLVTWNDRHLTYLMRKDTPEGIDFCERYPDLRIVNPIEFAEAIRTT